MGSSKVLFVSLLLLNIIDTILCYAQCGLTICTDDNAYCCTLDQSSCCYYDYIYSYWWFWFIWIVIFMLIASCSICCYRRRRYYRTNYAVVTDGYRPPAYGTVVSVTSSSPYPPQQVATAPPQYQPEPKPPAYVP